jgi:hypothetical protein
VWFCGYPPATNAAGATVASIARFTPAAPMGLAFDSVDW